jgi:hypothetical protein
MKTRILLTLLVASTVGLKAQSLGEFKPKDDKYGINKAKNAKSIYISNFSVSYQIYNEKEKFKQGGYQLGGGSKGDAKAEISVGLAGLSEADVQQITDKLYKDFVAKINAKGLNIINAEEAAKAETYSDYVRLQGGTVSQSQFPGMMSTAPTGYEFFVKKVAKDGKAKSGGFLGNVGMLYPKLSKELGDAIIADVNIYVMFVEDKTAFQGGGASLKVKTNLRIADQEAIVMTDNKSAIKFQGQNTITPISSSVKFSHGKMGLGATTSYNGYLGQALGIGGVLEDTKVTSFARGSIDMIGTTTMYAKYYTPENRSSETSKIVEVDSKRYVDGVYSGAKKFLDYHADGFLNDLK